MCDNTHAHPATCDITHAHPVTCCLGTSEAPRVEALRVLPNCLQTGCLLGILVLQALKKQTLHQPALQRVWHPVNPEMSTGVYSCLRVCV